ncbi:hypothetical protein [Amycolatopsis sp. WQ 127309]|uniref:hypothetical protein n=1 Tax=Amycolatopsis sp. WQ 127309 TaxID=2932773 RepID=UPI001FF126F0|nr:hypothetical protein [Amycolatopsis sp. WQ 127309]UOZ07306.1 hypothetical protein MUY22_03150 [Amycolatopsis sp. WQ 127309]
MANKKRHNSAKKPATTATGEKAGSGAKKWILGVVATVLGALLVAWMSPLPGVIKEKFFPGDAIDLAVAENLGSCTSFGPTTKKIEDVQAPPTDTAADSDEKYASWAHANNLATLDQNKVMVNITGRDDKPVTITGIRFVVTDRKPALTSQIMSNECGSSTEGKFAVVDLDQNPPKITQSTSVPRTWGDDEWRTTPLTFPYKVTAQDTEPLLLIAETKQCECQWKAYISWAVGDRTGTSEVGYKGQPFHTSASSNMHEYVRYNSETARWATCC